MLARIRKAVVAGVTAGGAAALASLQAAGTVDRDAIVQAVIAGLGAAILAGVATWAAPRNADKPTT